MSNGDQMGGFNLAPKRERAGSQGTYTGTGNAPKLVKLVIRLSGGLIRNERQANIVLLIFVIVIFIISLYLVFGGRDTIELPPDEILFRDTPNTPIIE